MATRKTTRRKKQGKRSTKTRKTTRKKATKSNGAQKRARASAVPASTKKAAKKAATKKTGNKAAKKLPVDDIEVGQRLLKELTALVEKASDQDAASILGGGALEGLLRAVLPQKKKASHSVYQHLTGHRSRASLMAQVRHAINESYSFPSPDGAAFVSPTRVQWFYDGLTFLYGDEPFHGVVGLYRNGELSWGLGVVDAAPGTSLGPLTSDFVTVDDARKSLKAADGEPAVGIGDMLALVVSEDEDPEHATREYTKLLGRHPWVLGAQHVSIEHSRRRDPNLPTVTAQRAADGGHDVVILESPALPVVGKSGKVLSSFSQVWHHAQRTMSFVQRQPAILERELGLRFDQPRCFVIAGSGLDPSQRENARRELEAHDATIRLVTYDDLHRLAERTLGFFEPRI